ncbi:hypothetical protein [Streptomyces sp. S.PB5]|uniref:hypothetical protein n=1 Tax=Streptomyces sp. S.PB5 TaxID=3020844 RepID=UPI0025B12E30|nr:hypothetical protein [Streptomyces sp. S.PB5]MDN3023106.1 hypothetical protein [Streptomyces sp. S.PB5]
MSDRSGLVSMTVALPAPAIAVLGLLWARPGAHEDEAAAVAGSRVRCGIRSRCCTSDQPASLTSPLP